jgi:hypothetical protein
MVYTITQVIHILFLLTMQWQKQVIYISMYFVVFFL